MHWQTENGDQCWQRKRYAFKISLCGQKRNTSSLSKVWATLDSDINIPLRKILPKSFSQKKRKCSNWHLSNLTPQWGLSVRTHFKENTQCYNPWTLKIFKRTDVVGTVVQVVYKMLRNAESLGIKIHISKRHLQSVQILCLRKIKHFTILFWSKNWKMTLIFLCVQAVTKAFLPQATVDIFWEKSS